MSIFTRFTCTSLKANRTRTTVSIIGVALSVALLTAVLTSVVSLTTMLVERTAAGEGWWYAEAMGITGKGLDLIESDPDVTDWAAVAELGTIELGEENSDIFGQYCYAKTWPSAQHADEPLVSTPEIVAGHMPERPGEIVLPHYFQNVKLAPCGIATADGDAIAIGSEVTLDLGTRTVDNADGSSYVASSISGSYIDPSQTVQFEADLGQLTGTVVGFYRASGYSTTYALQGSAVYLYDDGSALGRVISDASEATLGGVLFRTTDPAAARTLATKLSDENLVTWGTTTHDSLLRWMGSTPDTAIWNTLYRIAGILAAVVVVAGISLVYNSFAISVAERTRQFGLLSSLGASRRQLRRAVFTEALIIGAIGVPAGIALGLAGCYAVFTLLREGIAALSGGTEAYVVVSPAALAISALLGLAVLLASAWIPAIRASRVSAIDAIRQTRDVHLSRRGRRALRHAARRNGDTLAPARRSLGISGRLFGIPGFIAHRNLSRASSKGRITVAALAVSVALLIISGSIADVLRYASDTAVNTMDGQDLVLYIDATGAEADQTLALADGKVNGPAMQKALERFYAEAQDVEGATANGYSTSYVADALFPAGMLNDEVTDLESGAPRLSDGSWFGSAFVEFVDDASWNAYVDELGLSRDEFCDPAHPRAIVVNAYRVNDGETYGSYQPVEKTGTIESLEFADLDGRFVSGIENDADGSLRALYYDDEGQEHYLPYDEAVAREDRIEVAALADHAPACVVNSSGTLQIILPASAIDLAETMGYQRASLSFDAGGDATRASDAQEALEGIASEYPELDITYTNVAQGKLQSRLMATTMNTFIYLFAIITGLIAVANVFNTLANSLMLRRREFAMLKSIGMGNRAFRHMIAYECASYALRGLVIGFALAAFATAGLHESMRLSFSTYEPTLPWMQIGASVAIVLAVILASVTYALMRSRTANVVEALREDAI